MSLCVFASLTNHNKTFCEGLQVITTLGLPFLLVLLDNLGHLNFAMRFGHATVCARTSQHLVLSAHKFVNVRTATSGVV